MGTHAQLALTIPRPGILPAARHFTRLLLRRAEVCRVEPRFRWVRVLSGTAWITGSGEDIVVSAGDMRALPQSRDRLVLSPVGLEPLAVELGG
jgi:hypothetical protein